MAKNSASSGKPEESGQLNPEPLGPPENPTIEDARDIPYPALGGPDQPVVQVNVEDDMEIDGGSSPVREGATDTYGRTRLRTTAAIIVAIIIVLLLAFPVLWGLVELFALAGVVGPWIWAWAALLVAILIAVVVVGFRIAQSGF